MNTNKLCIIQYTGPIAVGDPIERKKILKERFKRISSYVTVHGGSFDEERIDVRANTIKAEIPIKYFKKVEQIINKQGFKIL